MCTTITSVCRIDPFNICVTTLLKQLHQKAFHRFRFVDQRLCSNFKPADIIWIDWVSLHQFVNNRKRHRVDVFAVSAETHVSLPQTDRIFPFTNTIKLFQFFLVDTCKRKVNFHRNNTHIFWPFLTRFGDYLVDRHVVFDFDDWRTSTCARFLYIPLTTWDKNRCFVLLVSRFLAAEEPSIT